MDILQINTDQSAVLAEARAMLAHIDAGKGTMPGEVLDATLDAILDDGLHPNAARRRYRGPSQPELARRTGLSQLWLSRIESCGGSRSAATRWRELEALKAPVWSLEGRECICCPRSYLNFISG